MRSKNLSNDGRGQILCRELLRLSEYRQGVLEEMVTLAQSLPEYEILLSIPGIAETTATSIIGELGDIRRFHSANQINAFIGIDLRHYESGNFLAKEHITKRGNPYARKILFKCIHNIASASHTNLCHIADFYEKRKKTIVSNFNQTTYDCLYTSSHQNNVLPHNA